MSAEDPLEPTPVPPPKAPPSLLPRRARRTKARTRRVAKILVLTVTLVLLGVAAVVTIRLLSFDSRQLQVEKRAVSLGDETGMIERLAGAIRFATVSRDDGPAADAEAFRGLQSYLRTSFPRTHQALAVETVSELSLLYRWPGKDQERPAIALLGHLDVVPAEAEAWSHPPFSGRVAEGFVWGRGTLDDKASVVAILEAVEGLLAAGFQPQQTVYLCFGHDEEIGGHEGAQKIAERLAQRGVVLEMALDEGLVITVGVLEGLEAPVALIGVAEKGLVNLELVARSAGGHASMPSGDSAVWMLSRALSRLQDAPMPASLDGLVSEMLAYIGPEMSGAHKLAMANLWLFGSFVESALEESPGSNALLRTTMVATKIQGGSKANVLPREARAVINARIGMQDSSDSVVAHIRDAIGDDRIEIHKLPGFAEPSPRSSTGTRGFQILQRTIRQLDPEVVVAPGLVIGQTDGRHYQTIAENVYRFLPVRLSSEDLARIHGVDERVSIEGYRLLVGFYTLLLESL